MRWLFGMLLVVAFTAHAEIVEEVVEVDNTYSTLFGESHVKMITTIWRDTELSNTPILIMHHGRGDPKAVKRIRNANASKFFVSLGFTVLVPTRIGYGDTGGPDIEYSSYSSAYYEPIGDAGANATKALIGYAKTLPYANAQKIVIAGGSYGGAIALASGARNYEGVIGVINVAGGFGGNPGGILPQPYGTESLFSKYGKVTKVPSLWLYGDKDEYWGPNYPKDWFAAYAKGGSDAQFIQYANVSHRIISTQDVWKEPIIEFLKRIKALSADKYAVDSTSTATANEAQRTYYSSTR